MTEQFCDKIMNEIKQKKVCPRPCWFYHVKRLSLWLAIILLIIVIGWSLAIDWHLLTSYDWEMARQTNIPLWRHAVMALPYLWLIVAGIGLWLIIALTRKTESGYRWPIIRALSVIFVIIGIVGFFGHLFKGDKIAHERMMRSRFYQASVFTNEDLWSRPDWGVLSGTIIEQKPDGYLMVKDYKNNVWRVSADNVLDFDRPLEQPFRDKQVRFKGERQNNCETPDIFKANWLRQDR